MSLGKPGSIFFFTSLYLGERQGDVDGFCGGKPAAHPHSPILEIMEPKDGTEWVWEIRIVPSKGKWEAM